MVPPTETTFFKITGLFTARIARHLVRLSSSSETTKHVRLPSRVFKTAQLLHILLGNYSGSAKCTVRINVAELKFSLSIKMSLKHKQKL